jgi:NAD(P)-dependent dehydrogenase (short-subunit alcohol dehydrogenase family)
VTAADQAGGDRAGRYRIGPDLGGRVAVVTGGTQGIGRAIAAELLAGGARVVVASRKLAGVEEAVGALGAEYGVERVHGLAANAGDTAQAEAVVAATMERFGRLDILVNNAATNPHMGPLVQLTESKAMKTALVNMYAPVMWARLAWEAWMAEHGGAILNVASVGGLVVDPGIGFYNATKAALIHLTRQLAYELGPNVRVNVVAPGLVKTELSRAVWEERESVLSDALPLRRLGTVSDIAHAARFLVSDQASWITGQLLVLDGGALALPIGVKS